MPWSSSGQRPQGAEFYIIISNGCLWFHCTVVEVQVIGVMYSNELNPGKSQYLLLICLFKSMRELVRDFNVFILLRSAKGTLRKEEVPHSLHICWLMLIYFIHVWKHFSEYIEGSILNGLQVQLFSVPVSQMCDCNRPFKCFLNWKLTVSCCTLNQIIKNLV